jgi:hypothetical protein
MQPFIWWTIIMMMVCTSQPLGRMASVETFVIAQLAHVTISLLARHCA